MKIRNIFGLTLAAALVFGSCAEKDMSGVDAWLGEKFNQEILWDVDSLAFRRTNWESQELANGVALRKSTIKMWESMQSVSYVTFSPVLFTTGLGYTGSEGTVAEIAENYDDVLFAINASGFANGKATEYVKLNDQVKNSMPSEYAEGLFGLNPKKISDDMTLVDATLTSDLTEHGSFNSAISTGAMIVRNGNAVKSFPEGEYYDTRMARSFVGMTAAGNCVFGVIDGGDTGHADGATAKEAAVIAQLMGLKNAALLGCGEETTFWSKKDGVLNAPSAGSAQKVGSVIYVAKGSVSVNGDGSESNPYLIDNHVHMMLMRSLCPANSTSYFRMEADVDMKDVKLWTPFNYDDPYTRIVHFDGNNKTISNFAPESFVMDDQATAAPYASFFGVLWGSCKNVTFKNPQVLTASNNSTGAGVLGGFAGTGDKPAVFENVHVVNGKVTGGRDVGLFGGQSRDASYKNCTASGVVVGGSTDAGGFIGRAAGKISMDNCHADVHLSAAANPGSNFRYGGLIGFAATIGGDDKTRDQLTITKCSTKGTIFNDSYSTQTAAGLIAYINTPTSNISECYTEMNITGGRTTESGEGGNMGCCGGVSGIVSVAEICNISNCYSTAETFIAGQKSGGLVGCLEKGVLNIENCYSTANMHVYSGAGGLFGQKKEPGELKMTNSFAWNPAVTTFRASDKYSSGAIVGSADGNSTIVGCFRNPKMNFYDPFRSLKDHADLVGARPANDVAENPDKPTSNNFAFDGMPSTHATLSAAAVEAKWSTSFWDFSNDVPRLNWTLN